VAAVTPARTEAQTQLTQANVAINNAQDAVNALAATIGSTTNVLPNTDDAGIRMNLPFNLQMGGVTYNNVYVGSNATITFGVNEGGNYYSTPNAPSISIAGYDWTTWSNGSGITYSTTTNTLSVAWDLRVYPLQTAETQMTQVRFNADVNPADGAWQADVSVTGPIPNGARFNVRETTNGVVTNITNTETATTGFTGTISQGAAFTPTPDPDNATVLAAIDTANAQIATLNSAVTAIVATNTANTNTVIAPIATVSQNTITSLNNASTDLTNKVEAIATVSVAVEKVTTAPTIVAAAQAAIDAVPAPAPTPPPAPAPEPVQPEPVAPPVVEPPVVVPPVVEPPAEEPPAEEPPAEEPPAEEPPAEEPPAEEPPAEEPPAEEPPAEEPPAEEPPAEEPPAEEPPAEEPPAEEPPAEEPPAEEPPAEEPEAGSEEAVEESVDDALSDGKIDESEAEDILNELASDGEVTAEEVQNLADALSEDGKLTNAEKELVVDALVESIAPGESLTKEQIQDAGIEYKDLPASTPVEVRQDENGNEVVIAAEVAASLVLLENPAELLSTALSDPGAALQALGNIGADMSDEEREEATDMVVATVVAAGAAINAAAVATGGATGGGTGGGGSSGGGSGANSPGQGGRRKW
jgi:polyhydroxyalkanoate synthesis regulator phasin